MRSTRSGRCGRIRASIAATRPASFAPTARLATFTSVCAPLDLSRRSPAGGAARQRLRHRAGGQPRQPHHPERRRHDAAARKAYDAGRVPRVDRRALPAGVSSPTRPTARSTSSTCIAASSSSARISREYLRDHILTNKLESPTGLGRIYRVVHETTKRDTAPRAVEARRRRSSWQRCRIRTAGGATRRSGCWSSAAIARSCRRSTKLARARRTGGRALHALWTLDGLDGIDAGTTIQGAGRSVARRARVRGPDCRALAGRTRTARLQAARARSGSTTRIGTCGGSWRRRSARCRPARASAAIVARARAARRRSRSSWTRR